jgi:Na+/H+-dicarboxylate symporter
MLTVVMFTLPFFCFLATLSVLMINGAANLMILLELIIIIALSLIVISAFYLVRLIIGKVKIKTFVRHLPALLWENFKISSVIDAVPFNIRYCSRKYGYNRVRLSQKLPILAQTNLDGNCFLITLISMSFIFLLGIEISWLQIIVIALLILFLSVGAPNQPGSIMIGMLIITLYLKADQLMIIAIFSEVLFGWIQNIINVLGDIVTVAIEEQKAEP